jgi:hypothetical protein
MSLISILGFAMGLLVPLLRVLCDNGYHNHLYLTVVGKENVSCFAMPAERSPIWPRYWRCLLGRSWKGQSFCWRKRDRLGEVCELAHPELRDKYVSGLPCMRPTPELQSEFERLWALDPGARILEMGRSPLHELDRSPLQ